MIASVQLVNSGPRSVLKSFFYVPWIQGVYKLRIVPFGSLAQSKCARRSIADPGLTIARRSGECRLN